MAAGKENMLRIITDPSNSIIDTNSMIAQRALYVSYRCDTLVREQNEHQAYVKSFKYGNTTSMLLPVMELSGIPLWLSRAF